MRSRFLFSLGLAAVACSTNHGPFLAEGDLLMASGKTDEAIANYREALSTGPNAAIRRALAVAYEANQQPELALKSFRAALDGLPNDSAALLGLSRVLAALGDISEARVPLQTLVDKQPTHPLGLSLLNLYSRQPDALRRAMLKLQTALKQSPRKATGAGHEVLADSLVRLGFYDRATKQEKLGEFATSLPPEQTLRIARAAVWVGRNRLAMRLVGQLPHHQNANNTDPLLLAEIYLKLGQWVRCQEQLRAREQAGNTPATRTVRAQLQLALGFQTSPIQQLELLLTQLDANPTRLSASIRQSLSTALLATGDFARAAEVLGPLKDHGRFRVMAQLGLAAIALARSNWEIGLQQLASLQTVASTNQQYHRLHGQLLLGSGNLPGAEKAFRRLLQLLPSDPMASLWLARTLVRQRNESAAKLVLEDTLKHFPEHASALGAWTRLLEKTLGSKKATAALEAFGRRHSQSAIIATVLAQWHRRHHQRRSALAVYRKAHSLDANSASALAGFGAALLRSARPDLARAVLDSSRPHESETPELTLEVARLNSKLNRPDRAQNVLEQGLGRYPNHPRMQAELALVLAELPSEQAKALALAQKAAKEAPTDPQIQSTLDFITDLFRKTPPTDSPRTAHK